MRVRRARVVGVLLALAHLVAARPFGQTNASVVPFSQSSVEFAQARRALTDYVMDNSNIRTAVDAWLADATAAETTYGHISTWDTSGVTYMAYLFDGASSFNEDIGAWDTSGVTTMNSMFWEASAFNQDISGWAVDSVGNWGMKYMFYGASAFDQDLGWCVDDDVDLAIAFDGTPCESTSCGILPAAALKCGGGPMSDIGIRLAVAAWLADATAAEATYGHISTWATGGVTDMSYLFCGYSDYSGWSSDGCNTAAASFNEDIGAWDTSGVTTMYAMFYYASAFNQDIGSWDTSGVMSMRYMFQAASAFNQDISGWAVHNVTDMYAMFFSASAFNQDISGWAVDSVTSMGHMFSYAYAFNQDLGWCVDDDVNLWRAFYNTPCESTSCGVGVKEVSCALPSPAPTTTLPSRAPTTTAAPTTPSPTPRPTPRPSPRPSPRPTQRPTRRPTPDPTSAPTPRPTREDEEVALVVSLCVVAAFLVVCGIIYAKKYYSSKSAKVAAVPKNAATDDGDTITVEAPPGRLGLKFDGTSTRVKEVFSDSPLVGKVHPGDVLKSVNGVLTFGTYLAAAADDCAAPRTLVFLRKQQPALATLVRMGTVEAVHAADASAAPPVQATLVPHATVLSVQQH
jgi:surface protein